MVDLRRADYEKARKAVSDAKDYFEGLLGDIVSDLTPSDQQCSGHCKVCEAVKVLLQWRIDDYGDVLRAMDAAVAHIEEVRRAAVKAVIAEAIRWAVPVAVLIAMWMMKKHGG